MEGIFVKVKKKFANVKISTKIVLFYSMLLIVSVILSSVLYQGMHSRTMSGKVRDVALQTLYSVNSNIDSMVESSKSLSKAMIASEEIQKPLKAEGYLDQSLPKSGSMLESSQQSVISADPDVQGVINVHLSKFIEAFPFISSIYIFDAHSQRYGIDRLRLKSLRYNDIKNTSWYADARNAQDGYILRLNAGGGPSMVGKGKNTFL